MKDSWEKIQEKKDFWSQPFDLELNDEELICDEVSEWGTFFLEYLKCSCKWGLSCREIQGIRDYLQSSLLMLRKFKRINFFSAWDQMISVENEVN